MHPCDVIVLTICHVKACSCVQTDRLLASARCDCVLKRKYGRNYAISFATVAPIETIDSCLLERGELATLLSIGVTQYEDVYSLSQTIAVTYFLFPSFVTPPAVITILYMSEVFFEKVFLTRPFKALFVTSDDSVHEWWFRWQLDRYR